MAQFGDISSNLILTANQSVRRNSNDSLFEAYTPASDISVNDIWTKFGYVDTSLLNLGIKNDQQDASLNDTIDIYTILDASLSFIYEYDAIQDASILALVTKDLNIDTSLNNIWVKFSSVDISLLNLGIKDANQDVSLNSIWTKLGSVDISLLNLGLVNSSQDASIVLLRSKDSSIDVSLNNIWVKLGSVDTSLNNLGIKNANQDISLNELRTYVDSSINRAYVDLVPYTGAFQDVSLNKKNITEINSLKFNPSTYVNEPYKLGWDELHKTLSLGLPDGGSAQYGQETFDYFTNLSGVTLVEGDVVSVTGATGNRLAVTLTDPKNYLNAVACIGMVTSGNTVNEKVRVTYYGHVHELNTSMFEEGDLLYVDPENPGKLTNIQPIAPNIKVAVGLVSVKHKTEGVIGVHPKIINSLKYLNDVDSSGLSTTGQTLIWNKDTSTWKLFDINLDYDNSTFYTTQDWMYNTQMAGRIYGGIITTNSDGTIDISAGYGISHILSSTPDSYADNSGLISPMVYVSWQDTSLSLIDEAYNYIYYDYATNTIKTTIDFYEVDFTQDFTIGRAYRSGNNVVARLCGTNVWNFNRRVQLFGEETFPILRAKGLITGDAGDRKITISASILWAELVNRFTTDAFDSSTGGTFTTWWRNGVGGWNSSTGHTQIDNTYWDDGTGTLNDLTTNRYGTYWVYVVHDGTVHVVYGQGNYLLAAAETASPVSSLPGLLDAYATLSSKIIVQKNAAQIYEIESAFTQVFTSTSTQLHNELSGLQGGTAGEYYHLTSAQYAGYVGKSYIDGSLLNRDASLIALRTKDGNIDTSLNGLWTKIGSVDTSLLNLGIKDGNQDVSLNEIWAKLDACIGSSSVNFGKNHQIPFMNDTSTNFEYLDRLRLSEETKDLIFSGAGLATVKIFGHESVDLNHFLEIHQDANNEISYINSTNSTLWLLADKSVAIGGFPTSGGGYPPDNSSTFLNVVCPSTYYDDILRVSPYGGFDTNSFLVVSADGSIKFPHIPEQSTSKVLYYDTVTKSISYSDVSDGGGTFNLWDVSTDNTTVFLRDPCDNLQLSYIEFHPDGGKLLFADMPIVNAETSMEQSYTMRIDGSSALKIYGVGANTALSETAVVVEANYFSLGDPKTDGSWRFVIDSSGNLSVQKRVSNSWVEKGNFN